MQNLQPLTAASLLGAWSHSHEEDQQGRQVFRRASYPFPPSRGRLSFNLLDDGIANFQSIARDDRHATASCHWSLDDPTSPELSITFNERKLFKARVLSVQHERLELQIEA